MCLNLKDTRQYFNPRSPHGERRIQSIHHVIAVLFQSTLPAWGATYEDESIAEEVYISIHAPRMGSDQFVFCGSIDHEYFNPRSPHGERQKRYDMPICFHLFQSTLPAWGATSKPEAVEISA